MDIIEQHFAAESAHDVPATLATYTDDLVWDDVGNPACPVYGKQAAAEIYQGIMDAIPDIWNRSAASPAVTTSWTSRSSRATSAARSSVSKGAERPCASGCCTCSTSETASSVGSRPGSTRQASSVKWSPTGDQRRRRHDV